MQTKRISRFLQHLLMAVMVVVTAVTASAAVVGPSLSAKIDNAKANDPAGIVIVSFRSQGVGPRQLNILRSVGITAGVTFPRLGMVGAVMTAGQVRALQSSPAIRSLSGNDQLQYFMNHARIVGGVDKVRANSSFTVRNQGLRVSGGGDFSVMVIDSGIDATHADLPYGSKVIQNTQRAVSSTSLDTGIAVGGVPVAGFVPALNIENLPNTDNVGHGTHVAGMVGGLGTQSAGNYAGVAPGVKIVGSGGGAVIVVLSALAGWEYALSHADIYKIRVITNSYGPIGGGAYDPDNPMLRAAKIAHDDYNITSLFAGGNDGAKGTLSPYAQAPWVIGVAAGSKEGMLASFSSRGLPREERLNDSDPSNDLAAPTLTAPGTGRYFEGSLAEYGFHPDIVGPRSSLGLTNAANTGDTEIPASMLPFYTSMSGTSMATPYVAGVVAMMLDVDPTLTPGEIKQILVDTATKMPGYSDWEVGAGYVNAYAAIDKAFSRQKGYENFAEPTFNARFTEERPATQTFEIEYDPSASGAASVNSRQFDVAADMSVLDVFGEVDTIVGAGTGNFVGMSVYDPNGVRHGATSIPTPVVGTSVRNVVVNNPVHGKWRIEIRGACSLSAVPGFCSPQQIAAPGTASIKVNQVKYILPGVPDLDDSPQKAEIERALRSRLMDIYADGTFRPEQAVTREDLARSLVLNTPLRQSIGDTPKFADVSGEMARIAEAVTSAGSTLRDVGFTSTPLMSSSGSSFGPADPVSRLDLAVAFVKALGHDAGAKALAGSTVTYQGTPLSDNASIPTELRGYVQIAIDNGMFEAFPAEIIQIAPGQFQAVPGPRFEPGTTVTRATLAAKLGAFNTLFTTGG